MVDSLLVAHPLVFAAEGHLVVPGVAHVAIVLLGDKTCFRCKFGCELCV